MSCGLPCDQSLYIWAAAYLVIWAAAYLVICPLCILSCGLGQWSLWAAVPLSLWLLWLPWGIYWGGHNPNLLYRGCVPSLAVVLSAEECRLMFAVRTAWYTEQFVPRPFSQLWGFAVGFFLWGLVLFLSPVTLSLVAWNSFYLWHNKISYWSMNWTFNW